MWHEIDIIFAALIRGEPAVVAGGAALVHSRGRCELHSEVERAPRQDSDRGKTRRRNHRSVHD
jgi:hypothetical protein